MMVRLNRAIASSACERLQETSRLAQSARAGSECAPRVREDQKGRHRRVAKPDDARGDVDSHERRGRQRPGDAEGIRSLRSVFSQLQLRVGVPSDSCARFARNQPNRVRFPISPNDRSEADALWVAEKTRTAVSRGHSPKSHGVVNAENSWRSERRKVMA